MPPRVLAVVQDTASDNNACLYTVKDKMARLVDDPCGSACPKST